VLVIDYYSKIFAERHGEKAIWVTRYVSALLRSRTGLHFSRNGQACSHAMQKEREGGQASFVFQQFVQLRRAGRLSASHCHRQMTLPTKNEVENFGLTISDFVSNPCFGAIFN
jgi:hypothetical protein